MPRRKTEMVDDLMEYSPAEMGSCESAQRWDETWSERNEGALAISEPASYVGDVAEAVDKHNAVGGLGDDDDEAAAAADDKDVAFSCCWSRLLDDTTFEIFLAKLLKTPASLTPNPPEGEDGKAEEFDDESCCRRLSLSPSLFFFASSSLLPLFTDGVDVDVVADEGEGRGAG